MDRGVMVLNYYIPPKISDSNESEFSCTGLNLTQGVDRLRTFINFPDSSLDITNLADAGFYYIHKDKVIKCAFCDISIFDLEHDTNLLNHNCCENLPNKSDCVPGHFAVLGENEIHTNTIVNEESLTDLEKNARETWLDNVGIWTHIDPKFEDFMYYDDRLKSFDSYPNRKLKFDKLSEAGFFYFGREDRTVCFHCGGGLKEWRDKDDPWVEHAYWFPRCQYLLKQKGKEFVRMAWGRQHEISSPEDLRNTTDALKELIDMITRKKNNATEKSTEGVEKTDIRNIHEPRPACKVCYIEERNTMFSPCCHIVACEHCAVNIRKCVVCREDINDTVRVFLA